MNLLFRLIPKSQIRVGIFEKNPKVWVKALPTDFSTAVKEYGVKKKKLVEFRHRHIEEKRFFFWKIGRFVFENTKTYKKKYSKTSQKTNKIQKTIPYTFIIPVFIKQEF